MNTHQKIDELVMSGYSVTDIAKTLQISRNTVKSYLQRKKSVITCLNCGEPLEFTPHKKKKKFCSDKCRIKWWNVHSAEMSRKSAVRLECQCCGKEFLDYSIKHRKYCSRSCYIKMRYGGADNA